MKRLKILFVGVGGQGILLATRILAEAALKDGVPVVASEVHGMAQRGGVVESNVLLGGFRSPLIAEGEADVLVSFEPVEALRALNRCHTQSIIITNTSPIEPFTVKAGIAQYPDVSWAIAKMKESFAKAVAYDAEQVAREAGTSRAVNITLLGTLMATALVPVSPETVRETLASLVKPKFREANLKAFELGWQQWSAQK
ncbi:indolepyruvate oxidoreductase subunit beta [Thermosulfuriphilus sp.]